MKNPLRVSRSASAVLTTVLLIGFTLPAHAQWIKQSGGLPSTWLVGVAMDAVGSAAVVCVRTTPPMMYLTSDGGAHFRALTGPAASPDEAADVSMIDTLHIWVSTYYGRILATTDGGATWKQQYYDTTATQCMDYLKMFDLNNGVAVGDAVSGGYPPVLQTTDGGAHWTNINTHSLQNMVSGDMWRKIDFPSMSVGYFYTSGGTDNPQRTYKTTNGGATWSPVLVQGSVMNLKFYNEQIGLARFGSTTSMDVARTLNGGATWEVFHMANYPVTSVAWGSDFEFLPGDPSRVWYADLKYLFFSSDTGRTWTQQPLDVSTTRGRDIVFTDAAHGWFLADNGLLYRTTNGYQLTITAIGEASTVLPSSIRLHQNYPNPFNPSTVIQFEIPRASHVDLRIFDMLGREIATLVSQTLPAGSFKVPWQANVPSGTYFYRLEVMDASTGSATGSVETKKMIVIR